VGWTLVSSVTIASPNGGSTTTAAIDTTGADLLVVVCPHYQSGVEPTITDSKGNTWTNRTSAPASSSMRCRISYTIPSSVGTGHTFTATHGASYQDMFVYAFSSGGGTPAFGSDANTSGASVSSLAASSITPSEDGALLITGFAFGTAAMTSSIDTGYTAATEFDYTSGQHVGGNAAYFVQGTAAAISPTWTFGATGSMSLCHACFVGAGGGTSNFNATGDLDAQSATISGAALHGRVSTGALAAQSAAIAGSAVVGRTATGALAAQSAAISGAATVNRVATGDLQAQAAAISGAAVVGRTATGALQAQDSAIDGSATVQVATFNATGDLQAGVATISGAATVNRVATGALQAQNATISGEASTTAIPAAEEQQASNWQSAYKHKKRLSKEELDELIRLQRIQLGILPPNLPGQAIAEPDDIAEEVTAAVQDVVKMAEIKIDRKRIYKAAYLEAEYAIEEYKALTTARRRRRTAAMLLLH